MKILPILKFSSITVIPLILTLFTLPLSVIYGGISAWQSATIGQAVALLSIDLIDGPWSSLAPKLGAHFPTSIEKLYRNSFWERLPRFLLILPLAITVLYITSPRHFIIATLSFLVWALNGLNAYWLTIATGDPKYVLRFTVLPRVFSSIIGSVLLILSHDLTLYFIPQLLFAAGGILALWKRYYFVNKQFHFNQLIDRNERFLSKYLSFARTASGSLPILTASIFLQNSAISYQGFLRYLEMVWTFVAILPTSAHGLISLRMNQKYRKRSHIKNLIMSLLSVLVAGICWPIIEKVLYRDEVFFQEWVVILGLIIIPIRTILLNITQDYLLLNLQVNSTFAIYTFNTLLASIIPPIIFIYFKFTGCLVLSLLFSYLISFLFAVLKLNKFKKNVK